MAAAGLASREKAEPIGPDVAADEFEQILREVEKLDTAVWSPPRVEPTAPATVARTIPQAPTVAVPERATRAPLCAENGSCSGDISSYTGRPKTVHVSGYYRKDGTYVRGHYRSRPRR